MASGEMASGEITSGFSMHPREWVEVDDKQHSSGCKFSAATYNILNSDFMSEGLYTYLPAHLWDSKNRHPFIMTEVRTMDTDIIAFQEVRQDYYDSLLYPDMVKLGYNGRIMVDEQTGTRTGQAIFWKQGLFKLLHSEGHHFHELAHPFIEAAVSKNTMKVEEKEDFTKSLKRHSVMLMTHLQEVTSGVKVIVGAVHLIWDVFQVPALKTLQVALGLHAISELSRSTGTQPMLLLGDFNSLPDDPVYRFLRDDHVTEETRRMILDQRDKDDLEQYSATFTGTLSGAGFGRRVIDVLPDVFRHDFHLSSAYRAVLGKEPEMTCAGDFGNLIGRPGIHTDTLDYVWFTRGSLKATGALRIPERSVVLKHTGLPSPLFPSDHLPLKAQFTVL